jgi:hypothetical protein
MRCALALVAALVLVCGVSGARERGSPDDVVARYLAALQNGKADEAYDLVSKAMRQGKDKEVWVKEQKALMAMADVKIFDFKVGAPKIDGDKALVPNVLESQDKFVNTLGLTEHELYTLVREDGAWKVDSQILLEQAEIPKWFPHEGKGGAGEAAGAPPSH